MKITVHFKQMLQRLGIKANPRQIAEELDNDPNYRTLLALVSGRTAEPQTRTIRRLCEWIKRRCPHKSPDEILHELVHVEPVGLWEAMERPGTAAIYLAEHRQHEGLGRIPDALVSKRDAVVSTLLLNRFSELNRKPAVFVRYVPHARGSRAGSLTFTAEMRAAAQAMAEIRENAPPRASVLIGSQHLLLEHFLADLFGVAPGVSLGRQKSPRIPFHCVFRDQVSRPASCFSGPTGPDGGRTPGVRYWDTARGGWIAMEFAEGVRDAGVVVVRMESGQSPNLQVAVWGISGWGTEALGRALIDETAFEDRSAGKAEPRGGLFWQSSTSPSAPCDFMERGLTVGVYVCRFKTSSRPGTPTFEADSVIAEGLEVIPIDDGVLGKCLR